MKTKWHLDKFEWGGNAVLGCLLVALGYDGVL